MQHWQQTFNSVDELVGNPAAAQPADVLLYFGQRQFLCDARFYPALQRQFPGSILLGCSTGTAVSGLELGDELICLTAIKFEKSLVRLSKVSLDGLTSFEAGMALGRELHGPGLKGVMVLSDGLNVNGSALLEGMQDVVGHAVPIGGGMAGDGAAFEETVVGANCAPVANLVAALGFYGPEINIRLGAAHGWDDFGPLRHITRSERNVLVELDGKPALDLYERYLGDEAEQLPSSALLYPLMIRDPSNPDNEVVRTVLSIDRERRTMTFAGDVPEGWTARLMRGVFDNLTDGAASAAQATIDEVGGKKLALVVSCVGRRLLMGQYTADEIEAVADTLGENCDQFGFYSYGEFATRGSSGYCGLHNQTMTLMTMSEA